MEMQTKMLRVSYNRGGSMASNRRAPARANFDRIKEQVLRCWAAGRVWVGKAGGACRRAVLPQEEDYHDHPEYKKAQAFRLTFAPGEGDYAWLIDYAKARYEAMNRIFQTLDEKADSLIKYLGGGTALVTFGTLAGVNFFNAWLPFALLPSVVCAVVAVSWAISARTPTPVPNMPSVPSIQGYQPYFKERAEAALVSSWEECAVSLELINQTKAKKVTRAGRWYFWSLAFLLIPLVVWPASVLLRPPVKQTVRVEMVRPDR
jgi:hypothetical protein